jgi:carboxylesterase
MATNPNLDPSEFYLEGGPVGVMLIHGFTGSPPEMRLIADYLNQRGLTVSGPLLPGHGTSLEDLDKRKWQEWTKAIENEFSNLRRNCQVVFTGGLSLGSLLSLYMAAHNDEMAGVMAYSPAIKVSDRRASLIPVLKYIMPNFPKGEDFVTDPDALAHNWSYDGLPLHAAHEVMHLSKEVRRSLPQVSCPILIVQGALDPAIAPDCAQIVNNGVSSEEKEVLLLNNSGHLVTIDSEWERVAEKTYKFIQAHVPEELLQ